MSSALLPRGANVSLQPALASGDRLFALATWTGEPPKQHSVDIAALFLGENGKTLPGGMLFHGQPSSLGSAVEIAPIAIDQEKREQRVSLIPAQIPAEVHCIAIVLIVQVAGHVRNIKALTDISLTMQDAAGKPVCQANFAAEGAETAMVLGEVYRRNGDWKFKHIGQGFQGGMRALAESFGLVVADAAMGTSTHVAEKGDFTLAPANPADITVFTPPKGGFTELKMNLTWAATVPTPVALAPKGLGALLGLKPGAPQDLDLDLCCLYELSDGHRGVVQALGENYGAYNSAPYVQLMGDARKGLGEAGELMRLNGARWHELHRIIVYAMIFEGAVNWKAAQVKLAVKQGDDMPVNIRPDAGEQRGRVMALAYLENKDGQMVLHKLQETYNNPRELDEAYHWGLRWTAGRKD